MWQAWNTLLLISGYLQSHYGMGHHFLDLPKESAVQAIKWQILGIPIANFCMACVKLSLCLLLVRIGLEKTWKWILCSLIGTLVVDTVVDTVVFLRRCTPLPSMWDLSIPNVCHYSIAAVNISHYVQIGAAPTRFFFRLTSDSAGHLHRHSAVPGAGSHVAEAEDEARNEASPDWPLLPGPDVSCTPCVFEGLR
jgi:hypothetical protein